MKLTSKNYYGKKASLEYISVSQYKDFFGTLERKGCEAQAMAIMRGEFQKEKTPAMLIGSYVDSFFEGTIEEFKAETPELFKKDGTLKAEYLKADEMIKRCEADKRFMQYMSGEKQVIMTAEWLGAKWKIKMDSYIKDKAIVDLKTVDDLYKGVYCDGIGKLNFIQAKGYDFQLAVYQKIVELNTGKKLPCYIAAVDKTKSPAIEVIQITQAELDSSLVGVNESYVSLINTLKKDSDLKPDRCGRCDYCKQTKIIEKPISMGELLTDRG